METFPHAFVPLFCSLKIELTFFFDGNLNESGLFPDLRGIHFESLVIYFYFFVQFLLSPANSLSVARLIY